jgi:hypothetical protein
LPRACRLPQRHRCRRGSPVVEQTFDLRRADGKGSFLALVPELAAELVGVRSDQTRQPFDEQLRALIEARPAITSLALPADTTRLRLSFEGDIRATQAGPSSVQPDVGPIDLTASAVFRDAAGLLHRAPTTTQLPGGAGQVEIPLTLRLADGSSAMPDGPLELVAVELSGRIPAGTRADGSVRLAGIEVAPGVEAGAEATWAAIDWQTVAPAWTYARIVAPRADPLGTVATDGAPGTVSLDAAAPVGWTISA